MAVQVRQLAWAAILIAITTSLMISALGTPRPRTPEDRVAAIARTVRCPTCQGQSAAESDAPASLAIRGVIDRQLRAGDSATTIRAYLADRYGPDILLQPPASGATILIWLLPVAALLVGAALVGYALRHRPHATATRDDEILVDEALSNSNRRV
jgi:cytochrome c-type biogenesis protein CcmH